MTIQDMADVLHARVLIGKERLDTPVYTACCSDLMSDVLAFVDDDKSVLITGMTNAHVLRTSEMLDLKCIVFSYLPSLAGGSSVPSAVSCPR